MAESLEMESNMKSSLKRILPILLAILVLCSMLWYLFVYDRDFTRDLLLQQARLCEKNGHHSMATWFYRQAYARSDSNQHVAIELAEQYKAAGNYTQAEATLSGAIADNPSAELYIALSKAYVEQNKLLDAVNMLENITNPAIKAELEALRPPIPETSYVPGYYNQYISIDVTAVFGTLYVSTDREYPSITEDRYSDPVTLVAGENTLYALAVSENGLVSRLAIFGYTVGGVVENVTLSDRSIDLCVRNILGLDANAPLLTSDLWTITELTVPAEAQDISDLRYLIGLQKLTMDHCTFEDLTAISGLTALTELTIRNCYLAPEDVAIVGRLPLLTKLTLSGCSLSTVENLSDSRSLTYLDLSNNTIRDIAPLSFMSALQFLDLSHNAVTNLNAISSLQKLSELNLSGNSLSSLVPLQSCTSLTWLDVSHNSILSLSGVAGLDSLKCLYAGYNQLTDIAILAGNTTLEELDVSSNSLTGIAAAATMPQLLGLNFSHNAVTSLPDFSKDCTLVVIDGSYNQLGTLVPLGGLPMLNKVILDYNNIYWVDPLVKCQNLIQLDIFGNPVSDVSKLTDMGIIVNYSPDV